MDGSYMKGMAMHLFYDTPMPSGQGILIINLSPEKIKIKPNIIKVFIVGVNIRWQIYDYETSDIDIMVHF